MQPVFVGDVQGCSEELELLVASLRDRFGARGFALWLVGDLVNRGPGSLQVLRRVRELAERGQARIVLGNHELSLLATFLGLRRAAPTDSFVDVLDARDSADWMDWLRRQPLVQTGQLGERPFAMVHASVAPGWSLDELAERGRRLAARLAGPGEPAGHPGWEGVRALLAPGPNDADRELREDLVRLTRCRRIDARGRFSEEEPARPADAWHARWAAADPAFGVVYGHWAMQGLHAAPLLRGLDTGCVHHGRGRDGFLTAWLPDRGQPDPFARLDAGILQIPALRAHYADLQKTRSREVSA